MSYEYKVESFVPTLNGCGVTDSGWDTQRCEQFQIFLNKFAVSGWKLHSYEFRHITLKTGCGKNSGNILICVFEKLK